MLRKMCAKNVNFKISKTVNKLQTHESQCKWISLQRRVQEFVPTLNEFVFDVQICLEGYGLCWGLRLGWVELGRTKFGLIKWS